MKVKRILAIGTALLVAALLFISTAPHPADAGAALWTHKSNQEIKWHRVTDLGTLLVGTDDAITCFDSETGKPAWTRNDLKKVEEDRVEAITGRPLLLVSTNSGFAQSKTKLYALDLHTGQTLWETEKLKGASVEI
jgi:outer membrane protein assembly factor BamB